MVEKEENSIQTLDDFVVRLNKAYDKRYPYHGEAITVKQLSFFANHANAMYHTFFIKKKSGGQRRISAPGPKLKLFQELIAEILIAQYEPEDGVCGFIRNKSIVDGARIHTHQHFVLNVDLKDFFDSFEWGQVRNTLMREMKMTRDVATLIASICCFKHDVERLVDGNYVIKNRNVLPQGAPSSPILTNILCMTLDRRLTGLAKKYGAAYSRYADDISFSHSKNIFKNDSSFRKQLIEIVESTPNLHINESKTRLQGRRYRQEVTGIVVNEQVNVPRRYISQIRKWLYLWERYGYQRANNYFTEFYLKDKGHIRKSCPGLNRVLDGKLNYLRMIKGCEHPMVVKLYQRYYAVTGEEKKKLIEDKTQVENIPIYDILQMIVDEM